MGWSGLSNSWKGAVIGGATFLISVVGLLVYILLSLGGLISAVSLFPIAILVSIKLVWGVVAGYVIGSIFKK